MRIMRSIPLSRLVLLLVGVFCVLSMVGCTQSAASTSSMKSAADNPDLLFQMNSDAKPTAKTLYAIAEILAAQGRDSECESVLRQVLREYPGFSPAYNSLAELFMRNGRTRDAVDIIAAGLRIHPTDPVLLNNAGMCWIVRRKYERALDMFIQAAGRKPENTRYRANMAVALGLMGRNEESLALFKQILPEDQANHNLRILSSSIEDSTTGSKTNNSS